MPKLVYPLHVGRDCMNAHIIQAGSPEMCTPKALATADHRPITARLPLSKYLKSACWTGAHDDECQPPAPLNRIGYPLGDLERVEDLVPDIYGFFHAF
jgi:hypothetical protein